MTSCSLNLGKIDKFKINLTDVREAARTIEGKIYRTPLVQNELFNQLVENKVLLKLENLQKTGAFKIRGNLNKILHLSKKEREMGAIAASSGNHALGLALASSWVGMKSTVVISEMSASSKIKKAKDYGAEVIISGKNYDEAHQKAVQLQKETGAIFIDSFEDPQVVAGNGTIALEILEKEPDIQMVVAPIGGGGLISGLLIAIKSLNPRIKVVGVQSEGAPSMYRSWKKGRICHLKNIETVAEGIAVKRPGNFTFPIVKKLVDDIVIVREKEIAETIELFLKEGHLVVEGAGAAPLSALIYKKIETKGKRIACVVTGGNLHWKTLKKLTGSRENTYEKKSQGPPNSPIQDFVQMTEGQSSKGLPVIWLKRALLTA